MILSLKSSTPRCFRRQIWGCDKIPASVVLSAEEQELKVPDSYLIGGGDKDEDDNVEKTNPDGEESIATVARPTTPDACGDDQSAMEGLGDKDYVDKKSGTSEDAGDPSKRADIA